MISRRWADDNDEQLTMTMSSQRADDDDEQPPHGPSVHHFSRERQQSPGHTMGVARGIAVRVALLGHGDRDRRRRRCGRLKVVIED